MPDSTSNSRGHNNNTPSALNNNNNKSLGNGELTTHSILDGLVFVLNLFNQFSVTPNSSLDTPIPSINNNNNGGSNHVKGSTVISADSSVASSISLDDDEENSLKVKKKDESHVSCSKFSNRCLYSLGNIFNFVC